MTGRPRKLKPRGRLVKIGEGRKLHAILEGPPASPWPLVVLEAGAFGFSADWSAVQAKLALSGLRSLAYDRAGLGFSPPGPEPRDGLAVRADLEALLATLGEAGPLIYCGHSMAGLHAALFARTNLERLKGVVLVDATTPKVTDSRLAGVLVDIFAGISGAAAWGSRNGLFAPWAGVGDTIGLDGEPSAEKQWAFADPGHNHWSAQEVSFWKQTAKEASRAGCYDPELPVAVILAGPVRPGTSVRALQALPAKVSHYGFLEHVPSASHATLLSARYCDAIIRGIVHVRDARPVGYSAAAE
ncbi:MAG: alpha/beta fold hydrolase [Caulobacteraceae bacterium]|nr:alpha/beta fold hydrolase [Caulobacteraceae bacterium]